MVACEECRKRAATVGCVVCRRNLCGRCFDEHASRISADMDEGFSGMGSPERVEDQLLVCEVCGISILSAEKDDHLFEVHGVIE